mmetsp:Transcript_61638/g.121877  ORF Transcript_61638/g.121877 Transcript_61638/m.121877 type:complete len:215 (+) Transcript_61638:340-984(+)
MGLCTITLRSLPGVPSPSRRRMPGLFEDSFSPPILLLLRRSLEGVLVGLGRMAMRPRAGRMLGGVGTTWITISSDAAVDETRVGSWSMSTLCTVTLWSLEGVPLPLHLRSFPGVPRLDPPPWRSLPGVPPLPPPACRVVPPRILEGVPAAPLLVLRAAMRDLAARRVGGVLLSSIADLVWAFSIALRFHARAPATAMAAARPPCRRRSGTASSS